MVIQACLTEKDRKHMITIVNTPKKSKSILVYRQNKYIFPNILKTTIMVTTILIHRVHTHWQYDLTDSEAVYTNSMTSLTLRLCILAVWPHWLWGCVYWQYDLTDSEAVFTDIMTSLTLRLCILTVWPHWLWGCVYWQYDLTDSEAVYTGSMTSLTLRLCILAVWPHWLWGCVYVCEHVGQWQ